MYDMNDEAEVGRYTAGLENLSTKLECTLTERMLAKGAVR